jgi:hypothetical protein
MKLLVLTAFMVGGAAGAASMRLVDDFKAAYVPSVLIDFKRLDEIDTRLRALEGRKCVSIQTDRFDMIVVPSLGVEKPALARNTP